MPSGRLASPSGHGAAASTSTRPRARPRRYKSLRNNADGFITGRLSDGTEFETYGPFDGPTDGDLELLRQHGVDVQFHSPEPTLPEVLLPLLLPVALLLVAAGGVVGWLLVHGRGRSRSGVQAVDGPALSHATRRRR